MMQADVGKVVQTWMDFVRLPYTLSFYELGSGGLTGVQFLVFLPFLIILKKPGKLFNRRERNVPVLLFALLFLLAGSFFTGSIRFMYIALVLLSIYTVLVFHSLENKIATYLLYIIIGLNIITGFGYHERIYRSHYLYSGKVDAWEYKTVGFPSYPAVTFVNTYTPEGSNILVVGETRGYYLKRPYRISSALDYSILKKYLAGTPDYTDFVSALKKDDIHFIIFNRQEFERLQKAYKRLSEKEMEQAILFLNTLKPVYHKGELYVLQVK
ncbi:MAG: hypothetical protein GY757_30100 [bacterium]|nr:hypothetical protein [bacterium]